MSEAEAGIRGLEVKAAAAMGWRWWMLVYKPKGFVYYHQRTTEWIEQTMKPGWEFEEVPESVVPDGWKTLGNTAPRFARDPEAILEALTWLLSQGGSVCRKDYLPDSPFEATLGGDMEGWFEEDPDIGIAICKAICATCQTSEGNKMSDQTLTEEQVAE